MPQIFKISGKIRPILFFSSAVILTLGISISFQSLLAAWTAPLANPPTCAAGNPGCDAPLNTGALMQTKGGPLWINTGVSPTGLIVEKGKAGIGTASPALPLHVISNAGNTAPVLLESSNTYDTFSILPYSGVTYLSSGVYYNNGTWVHDATGAYNALFAINPSSGAYWYDSNNSTPSWNVAANVQLWNATGYWKNLVQSDSSSSSYFTGSLGVGVASPAYKLQVNGGVYSSGGSFGTYGSGTSYGAYGYDATNGAYGYLGTSGYGGYFIGSGGVFSQNTSGYYTYLDYPGTSWGVYTNGGAYISGSVGIGVSPSYALQVAGNIGTNGSGQNFIARYTANESYKGTFGWNHLQLGNNGPNDIIAGRTAANGYFRFFVNATNDYGYNDTNGTLAMTISPYGNVTIGSAGITDKLVVGGRTDIIGGTTNTNDISFTIFDASYTYNMYVRDNGNGYLRASAWAYGSDRRMKENISYLDGVSGLDKILQLKPVRFDYIDGQKNQLGFIAQDIQSVIPEAVSVTDEKTGMLGLKTDFIIPYLVNSIKEQQEQIEKLKMEIEGMKK